MISFRSVRDLILNRRRAYKALFLRDGKLSPDGEAVLAHLKRFARYGHAPLVVSPITGQSDPLATAVRMGRQEVVQLIIEMLHLDDRTVTNVREEVTNDES